MKLNRKKEIERILILLGIILILFLAILYFEQKKEVSENSKEEENYEKNNQGNSDAENESEEQGSTLNFNNETGNEEGDKKTGIFSADSLPSDLETRSCGFYYSAYGICAGYCEVGKCVSEERSCYCKL